MIICTLNDSSIINCIWLIEVDNCLSKDSIRQLHVQNAFSQLVLINSSYKWDSCNCWRLLLSKSLNRSSDVSPIQDCVIWLIVSDCCSTCSTTGNKSPFIVALNFARKSGTARLNQFKYWTPSINNCRKTIELYQWNQKQLDIIDILHYLIV